MDPEREIRNFFKLNGIICRADAIQYLGVVGKGKNTKQLRSLLDQVVRFIQRQPESSVIVSKNDVEIAVKDFTLQDDSSGTDFFWVISAFDVPRVVYDPEKKLFHHAAALGISPPPLHAHAESKAFAFVERYEMLFNRALRSKLFIRSSMDKEKVEGKFSLHIVEELLSSSLALHNINVLGMISSLQEGKFHLEDTSGAVELEVSASTVFHTGLYTHNVFVLVQGWYEDHVLHATGIGMPMVESRELSRVLFGDFNFFGGSSQISFKASSKLLQIEKKNPDAMFVIVSDVWLDLPEILSKLGTLFEGFSGAPPFGFIFCGNFISESENLHHDKMLQDGLKALSDLLQKYPSILQNSRFIFVPGPTDAGVSGILPRPAIPKYLTADFERTIKNATFTTNPCRIQYCTKEIVIIREDILTKVCRTLIRDPQFSNKDNRFSQLTKNLAFTIKSQGHLCPLEPHILPTYWSFDHALRLYSLPDLIIVADIQEPFIESGDACLVANPSSFPRHNFQFLVYIPATNTLEMSEIS